MVCIKSCIFTIIFKGKSPSYSGPRSGNKPKMMCSFNFTLKVDSISENARNETKVITQRGPIGLHLTGTLAQIFMLWWDREFRTKLRDLKMPLHRE